MSGCWKKSFLVFFKNRKKIIYIKQFDRNLKIIARDALNSKKYYEHWNLIFNFAKQEKLKHTDKKCSFGTSFSQLSVHSTFKDLQV